MIKMKLTSKPRTLGVLRRNQTRAFFLSRGRVLPRAGVHLGRFEQKRGCRRSPWGYIHLPDSSMYVCPAASLPNRQQPAGLECKTPRVSTPRPEGRLPQWRCQVRTCPHWQRQMNQPAGSMPRTRRDAWERGTQRVVHVQHPAPIAERVAWHDG
jgi:hypothetical protein